MNWGDAFKIIASALASTGVGGAIILGLSSWLGKVWANRLIESIKKVYQKEIESYRTQLEILKTTALRYSGEQFNLYNKLWHSLCDLRSAADVLWERAICSGVNG